MFSFSLTSRYLLISSFISSMTHWSLSNVLFSFQLFACFLIFFIHLFTCSYIVWVISPPCPYPHPLPLLLFLLLSSSFNALWSDRMHGIIYVFLYFLRLCALRYNQFWRKLGFLQKKNGEKILLMGCWEECLLCGCGMKYSVDISWVHLICGVI
jgi:hypothetical protein